MCSSFHYSTAAQPLLKLRCSARGFSSWPSLKTTWALEHSQPARFSTELFWGKSNNVRSRVESFVRSFILHLVPNAASNLQIAIPTQTKQQTTKWPKVCMMPQIMDEKRINDKHLDLEEKLYGAALMGLPCNKVDPLNFYLVD